jgi:hypothetical protein
MTTTPLLWDTPLGFCIGFEPVIKAPATITAEPPVPLLEDDGCESSKAACFFSGDDLIVRAETEPPTPVQHPSHGGLWPAPDALLFRSQAELDAWIEDSF